MGFGTPRKQLYYLDIGAVLQLPPLVVTASPPSAFATNGPPTPYYLYVILYFISASFSQLLLFLARQIPTGKMIQVTINAQIESQWRRARSYVRWISTPNLQLSPGIEESAKHPRNRILLLSAARVSFGISLFLSLCVWILFHKRDCGYHFFSHPRPPKN